MKLILEHYTKAIVKQAKEIKAIFMDVDGVLTDGKIVYDDQGRELKHFNVKDGQIVSYLKKSGMVIGAISGRDSVAVARRCNELKFDFCHQGILDKAEVCKKLMAHHKLKSRHVAYIGDDINDLDVFKMVGLSVCPDDALGYVKAKADLVTFAKGGEGVLREVSDLVLASKGGFEKLIR